MGNLSFFSSFPIYLAYYMYEITKGEISMAKFEKINLNGTIAESTELVSMLFSDNLTKRHLDVLLSIISLANTDDTTLEFEVPVPELAKIYNPANPWGVKTKNEVHKIVSDLMNLKFGIYRKDFKKTFWYHWVESVGEPDNINDTITITLSNDVKRFFIQFHRNYFVYTLKNILVLRTLTEARIYHWAYAKKGFKNDVPISINDAKLFFCGKTDISNAEFIRTYLKPALIRINEKTDLNISYEKVCADKTDKRLITSLKFKIKCDYEKAAKEPPKRKRSAAQLESDRNRLKEIFRELYRLEAENIALSERNLELEFKELLTKHNLEIDVLEKTLAKLKNDSKQ